MTEAEIEHRESLRPEFEAWLLDDFPSADLVRGREGEYRNTVTREQFNAWCGCEALRGEKAPHPLVNDTLFMDLVRNGVELHPVTANLVACFARALAAKLSAAEKKYGYTDGWCDPNWMGECRAKLVEHIAKGDPRDVAAYCAFLWHHGKSTAPPERSVKPAEAARRLWETIKILGLSNDRLALQAIERALKGDA